MLDEKMSVHSTQLEDRIRKLDCGLMKKLNIESENLYVT